MTELPLAAEPSLAYEVIKAALIRITGIDGQGQEKIDQARQIASEALALVHYLEFLEKYK